MKRTPVKKAKNVALIGYLFAAVLLGLVLAETALGNGRPAGVELTSSSVP